MSPDKHPRDAHITIYGRKPVLEALELPHIQIVRVLVARRARGEVIDAIEAGAAARGVELRRVEPREVTRLSRNAKQDQGVVADVLAPRMDSLARWLDLPEADGGPGARCRLLVLDGLTNPQNVGMILRSAVAAGIDGVVVPRRGCPEVGPLVVKGSAGVAFRARILRTPAAGEALDLLGARGFSRLGLAADAAVELGARPFPERVAFALGGETRGLGEAARAALDGTVRIAMEGGVESLNVAVAAALVAFELRRRGPG